MVKYTAVEIAAVKVKLILVLIELVHRDASHALPTKRSVGWASNSDCRETFS